MNLKVAIKVLFPEVMTNPDLMKIVQMEIQILSQINHRYIIKLLDHFSLQGQYFMVYEFCEKGDLKMEVDRKGRLSEIDALKTVYQLSEALCELRRHHIIHRDIKPENIFLTKDICKLGDFGLCYLGDRVQLNASVGSLGFLAPETQSMLIYSSKADVYSLGICFYEMIHGDIPFTQDQISNLYDIKLKLKIERNPHINISDTGLNLMRRMIDPNEQTRIDCGEIRDMLAHMFPNYHPSHQATEPNSQQLGEISRQAAQTDTRAPPPRSLAQSKNTFSCVNILSNEMMPSTSVSIQPLAQKPESQASLQSRMASPMRFVRHETPALNQVRSVQVVPETNFSQQSSSPARRINYDILPKLQKAIDTAKKTQKFREKSPQNERFQTNEVDRSTNQMVNGNVQGSFDTRYHQQPIQSQSTVYSEQAQPQGLVQRLSIDSNSGIQHQPSSRSEVFKDRASFGAIGKTASAPQPPQQEPSHPSYAPIVQITSQSRPSLVPAVSGPTPVNELFDKRARPSAQPLFQTLLGGRPTSDHQRSASVAGQANIAAPVQGVQGQATLNNISSIIDAYRIDNKRPQARPDFLPSASQAPQYPIRQLNFNSTFRLTSTKSNVAGPTRVYHRS